MNLVDTLVGTLAPHQCLACGVEGYVLCPSCQVVAGQPLAERCAGCRALSKGSKTCKTCRKWLPVTAVYIATAYEGVYERLIRSYKFDVQRQAAKPITSLMLEKLPDVTGLTVCPVPTAPSRIRQRGFDHARLLAKELTRQNKELGSPVYGLKRRSNTRQLGSSRQKRMQQMKDEFYVDNPDSFSGKEILLVDDVVTTGASLAAAAMTLKKAGAKRVYGLVFAQKT